MDDEPKRPVAMSLTELNACNEDDAVDHVFEADDMQVAYSIGGFRIVEAKGPCPPTCQSRPFLPCIGLCNAL